MPLLEKVETTTSGTPGARTSHAHHVHLPHPHVPAWLRRVPSFLAVGTIATVAYALLYLALRSVIDQQVGNAVALVASTVLSTDLNRRLTFGVRERSTVVPHQALGFGVLLAGLGVTSGALWLLSALAPGAGWMAEIVVLGLANGLAGTIRFVSFNLVMHPDDAGTSGDVEKARAAPAPA